MAFALLAHKWVAPRAESRARVESQVSEVQELVSAEAASILAHPPMRLLVAHQDSVERLQSLLHINAALTGGTDGIGTGGMLARAPSLAQPRAPAFIEDGLSDVRRLVWPDIEASSTSLLPPVSRYLSPRGSCCELRMRSHWLKQTLGPSGGTFVVGKLWINGENDVSCFTSPHASSSV